MGAATRGGSARGGRNRVQKQPPPPPGSGSLNDHLWEDLQIEIGVFICKTVANSSL